MDLLKGTYCEHKVQLQCDEQAAVKAYFGFLEHLTANLFVYFSKFGKLNSVVNYSNACFIKTPSKRYNNLSTIEEYYLQPGNKDILKQEIDNWDEPLDCIAIKQYVSGQPLVDRHDIIYLYNDLIDSTDLVNNEDVIYNASIVRLFYDNVIIDYCFKDNNLYYISFIEAKEVTGSLIDLRSTWGINVNYADFVYNDEMSYMFSSSLYSTYTTEAPIMMITKSGEGTSGVKEIRSFRKNQYKVYVEVNYL